MRYAIDASKVQAEMGWVLAYTYERGIRGTMRWYLDRQTWVTTVLNKEPAAAMNGLPDRASCGPIRSRPDCAGDVWALYAFSHPVTPGDEAGGHFSLVTGGG